MNTFSCHSPTSKTFGLSKRIGLISSCVDLGTSSITKNLEDTFAPYRRCYLYRGFKQLTISDLLRVLKFFIFDATKCDCVIAVFNAPVLLTGIFGWIFRCRKVAILEWNELTERSRQKIPFFRFYGWIYKTIFTAYDQLFSPSPNFVSFYKKENFTFSNIYFPLPQNCLTSRRSLNTPVRMLFVGGDIKRKGGDLLLSVWSANPPNNATLTFVSPHVSTQTIPGVQFVNHICSGTVAHQQLFDTHDVLILPTHSDSFGYVLLEALSAGMAVITTRHAGAAHVVTLFGGLVMDDPDQAVSAAIELVRCPQKVSDLQHKASDFRPSYATLVSQSVAAIQSGNL